MAAGYWSAVVKYLPKAEVVFDHFHIIKLANERIDELRRGACSGQRLFWSGVTSKGRVICS